MPRRDNAIQHIINNVTPKTKCQSQTYTSSTAAGCLNNGQTAEEKKQKKYRSHHILSSVQLAISHIRNFPFSLSRSVQSRKERPFRSPTAAHFGPNYEMHPLFIEHTIRERRSQVRRREGKPTETMLMSILRMATSRRHGFPRIGAQMNGLI